MKYQRGVSLLALGLFVWGASAQAVGTRHFVLESAKDFEAGQSRGVFVDSVGRLRPGFRLIPHAVAEAPSVWATFREQDGALLLATGNEGKLLRLKADKLSVVADTEELALTSIVSAWGRTFVASLPKGHIYELKGDRLEVFATLPGAEHVWGLAFDDKSRSLFAATGPEGKLFRLAADGTAQVYFDAEQNHLVSLSIARGIVFVGSSGGARLYRLDGPGRATVVQDFSGTEVRGVQAQGDGSVYAIVNELKGGPRSDSWKADRPASAQNVDGTKGSGELYYFRADGSGERLFASKDDFFSALAVDKSGAALVGTGAQGRVYRVTPEFESVMLADIDERQVSAVAVDATNPYLVGSDPVVVYDIQGLGGRDGTFESETLDAGLRARFGRIRYDAEGQVEVETRSGNTKEADSSWSDWSKPLRNGDVVPSPKARFLQVRVRMPGATTSLRRLEVPFVTENLRATITKIDAKSASLPKSEVGIQASGGPVEGEPSTQVKVTYEVENPDEDTLRYRVEYRRAAGGPWVDALGPGEVLTKKSFNWETSSLAEGLYRLRVTATDELANDPRTVTRHSLESALILVDNTPPRLVRLGWQGKRLIGAAEDGLGPIRRVEVRIGAGQEWWPVGAEDGVYDQAKEDFSLDMGPLLPAESGGFVTVRAYDAAGNWAVGHIEMRSMR